MGQNERGSRQKMGTRQKWKRRGRKWGNEVRGTNGMGRMM